MLFCRTENSVTGLATSPGVPSKTAIEEFLGRIVPVLEGILEHEAATTSTTNEEPFAFIDPLLVNPIALVHCVLVFHRLGGPDGPTL